MLHTNEIKCFLESNHISYHYNYRDISIETYSPIGKLAAGSISWVRSMTQDIKEKIEQADNVIIVADIKNYCNEFLPIFYVENPHRVFFMILSRFFSNEDYEQKPSKIESSATVLTERVGKNVYIGHHSFVDKDVIIDDNVVIMHNCVIQGKVAIGANSTVESGAMIGVCGFGHYKTEQNNPVCVPHLGGVIIGKHVHIGAGTAIARGCLSDTIISDYVKCDNLVHIAHNVVIGERTMIAACSEISGSSTIGNDVWIAPGTTVINGVNIGNGVYTGLSANVLKDVPDHALIYGNPGRIKEKKQ